MHSLNDFELTTILHNLDTNIKAISAYKSTEDLYYVYTFELQYKNDSFFIRCFYRIGEKHSTSDVIDYAHIMINLFSQLNDGIELFRSLSFIKDGILSKYKISYSEKNSSYTFKNKIFSVVEFHSFVNKFISDYKIKNPKFTFMDLYSASINDFYHSFLIS